MKLTFKDLKQQKFVIEAEPSETIADVKQKISQEKGWDAAQQKLIYSGKILNNDNTVESYKIEEKGFIVCMVSKPKAAPAAAVAAPKAPATPAPAAAAATPAQPPTPRAPSQPRPEVQATPSPAGAGATATADTPATPEFNDPSALTIGSQRAEAIANLESMGFERTQIDLAMRAAFFNPDRAVEYLLNGIPENIRQEQQQAAAPITAAQNAANLTDESMDESGEEPVNLFEAAAQVGSGRGASRGAAGAGGDLFGAGRGARGGAAAVGSMGNLEFLRNNAQFQQLRQVVQQQPQMLEPILQQVGAGNPQLAELIGQHPEQFLQLLSEDADDDAPLPPGAQSISVTDEERDAIERLCRLGFERDQAIQAYFACDKNEELAANFLFDQPEDDEGPN